MRFIPVIALLLVPLLARAASFREFTDDIQTFVNTAVVPLIYSLAFLFFLFGMVRFFFAGGEEAREKGKKFMLWGVIGLVVMFSVWGIVNMLLATLGIRA